MEMSWDFHACLNFYRLCSNDVGWLSLFGFVFVCTNMQKRWLAPVMIPLAATDSSEFWQRPLLRSSFVQAQHKPLNWRCEWILIAALP